MKNIFIGADHGGFELKQAIKEYLIKNGYNVTDFGTNSCESVDYPKYGHDVANAVVKNNARGIVICGSGIGISIAANRIKGARAALVRTVEEAILTRKHNDANILALGGRFTSNDLGIKITKAFLETEFEGGRHIKRVEGIEI